MTNFINPLALSLYFIQPLADIAPKGMTGAKFVDQVVSQHFTPVCADLATHDEYAVPRNADYNLVGVTKTDPLTGKPVVTTLYSALENLKAIVTYQGDTPVRLETSVVMTKDDQKMIQTFRDTQYEMPANYMATTAHDPVLLTNSMN